MGLNAKVAKSAKGATVGVRSDKKDREDVKEPKLGGEWVRALVRESGI